MLNGEVDDTEFISDSLESMGIVDTGTNIDGTKALAPDDFTSTFYKKTSHLIGADIFYMVLEFFFKSGNYQMTLTLSCSLNFKIKATY
jgi:hypothetical protein